MGLLATSYLSLYRSTNNDDYLLKAEGVLDWLYSNSNSSHEGHSWGYPFHWQSRVFFPRGTPSSVVTGTVGDAWLDHYLLTGCTKSLEVCHGIARFFLNCLNQHSKSDNQVCFSYTPLDNFRVHNASLFVANFLARLGEITDNEEFKKISTNAVHYTLSEQNLDGSFNYWGGEVESIIDHYHTGFVSRLDAIRKAVADDSFQNEINRGYQFYRKHLFNDEGIPKFTPDSLYPIDIHSCSEAILTLCQLEEIPQEDPLLAKVIDFNSRNMLSNEGYYFAEIRKRFWGEQKIKIPYMRWGQCWMLLSFARLFEILTKT